MLKVHREKKTHTFRSDKYLIFILRIPTLTQIIWHRNRPEILSFTTSHDNLQIVLRTVWWGKCLISPTAAAVQFGIFHRNTPSEAVLIYMQSFVKPVWDIFGFFNKCPETRANIFQSTHSTAISSWLFHRLTRSNVVAEKYQSDFKMWNNFIGSHISLPRTKCHN